MLLETLLSKINKVPDNLQGEMNRLEKKIDTKDITLKKGSVGLSNLELELGMKIQGIPDDINKELQTIRDALNNATVKDGSIDEAKLNQILKDKINSVGDLSTLTTSKKSNIVESINEVSASVTNLTNGIPPALSQNLIESKNYTDTTVATELGKIVVPTITFGTANPSGGKHGDIYIKHA